MPDGKERAGRSAGTRFRVHHDGRFGSRRLMAFQQLRQIDAIRHTQPVGHHVGVALRLRPRRRGHNPQRRVGIESSTYE